MVLVVEIWFCAEFYFGKYLVMYRWIFRDEDAECQTHSIHQNTNNFYLKYRPGLLPLNTPSSHELGIFVLVFEGVNFVGRPLLIGAFKL